MASTSTTHLERLLNLEDPLLSFKWITTYLPFDMSVSRVEAIDLPMDNIQPGESPFVGGRFYKTPGSHTISSFQLSLYEDRKASALAWIMYWKSQIKDFSTGVYKLPKDFKRPIKVSLLDQKNVTAANVTLKNCWPSDTSPLSLNYTDGSSRIIVQQTFEVDEATWEFPLAGR